MYKTLFYHKNATRAHLPPAGSSVQFGLRWANGSQADKVADFGHEVFESF